jgi:hypothetical protein
VCCVHAAEFWTSLLAFVKERSSPEEEGVKTTCACRSCNELSASNHARALAAVVAGWTPEIVENITMRRAS